MTMTKWQRNRKGWKAKMESSEILLKTKRGRKGKYKILTVWKRACMSWSEFCPPCCDACSNTTANDNVVRIHFYFLYKESHNNNIRIGRMMIESFGSPVCKSVVVLIAWKTLTVGKVFCCQAVLQTSMLNICDLRFF